YGVAPPPPGALMTSSRCIVRCVQQAVVRHPLPHSCFRAATARRASSHGWHLFHPWKGVASFRLRTLQNRSAMQLTKKFVKAKNPCTSGYRWFLRDQNGQGDYQAILDALIADNRVDDACWLLDQFGPTDAVLTVDFIDAKALVFAGTLIVRQGIAADTVVRAGGWIRTEGGIKAG